VVSIRGEFCEGKDMGTRTHLLFSPDGVLLSFLRAAALAALPAGALGAVGLTIRAGRTAPRFLLALFIIWVLSPFVALTWTSVASKGWPVLTRAVIYCLTLVIALGSLARYEGVVPPPAGSPHAFVYVIVPLVSELLIAVIVPVAALVSGRRSRRSNNS
jgi:hypothetical protein